MCRRGEEGVLGGILGRGHGRHCSRGFRRFPLPFVRRLGGLGNVAYCTLRIDERAPCLTAEARFSTLLSLLPAAALADDDTPKSPPTESAPRSSLDILIDKSKVDLEEHRLEVKMNHVASKVTLKVYDDTGAGPGRPRARLLRSSARVHPGGHVVALERCPGRQD